MASSLMKAVPLSCHSALISHTVVYVDTIAYYVRNRVEWTFPQQTDSGGVIIPAVVIDADLSKLTPETLKDILRSFREEDDVYQDGFAKYAVLVVQTSRTADDEPADTFLESITAMLDSWQSTLLLASPADRRLPQGPYFLRGRSLHQVWRFYPDESQAFTSAVVPSDQDNGNGFQSLHAAAYSGLYPVVAVPSRLYTPPSSDKPLNGTKVSIKDIFHLKGVHTAAGSRSYTRVYGQQPTTCEIVQRMIEKGALIVGKTKLSAYSGSEVPPEKCIDYFAPWNPRGDGYQGPSGSSSGAGSSVASYPGLDLALGTDSTGSIRMPAASYGLWGLRASWGSLPMDGILPNVEAFDTMGILARSPKGIRQVLDAVETRSTIGNTQSDFPNLQPVEATGIKLLYPTDWFPMQNASQQNMIDMFVAVTEEELQVRAERVFLEQRWSETAPKHLRSIKLAQYLDKSVYWPNYYDGFHSWDGLRADHEAKFQEPPYASPFMTKRWGIGNSTSKEQRNQGLEELAVYKAWVHEHVINQNSHRNIMFLPLGRPGANYRDIVPAPGGEWSTSAYNSMSFSTVLGLPQLVTPIGQNPYTSRVTDKTEYAPIVGSLIGPHGSDKILLRIAESAMKKAGWPTEVFTERNVFLPGDNDRHVDLPSSL